MITVIKSLLDKDGDFYKDILSEITSVDNLENISGQELDVFNYLSDSYNNSGFTPSSNLLLEKFPEYEIPLSQSKTLDGRDLQVYLGNVLKQRRDMSLSRKFMSLANKASSGDLTQEEIDSVMNSAVQLEEDDTPEIDIDSEEGFKQFYEQKKTRPKGIVTTIPEIDEKIGGVPYGFIMTIAAFVGNYKSLLATNIAYHNAKKLGYNVCYMSLEVPKDEMLYNLFCRMSVESKYDEFSFLPHKKIREMALNNEEEEYMFERIVHDYYDVSDNQGIIKILDETSFNSYSFLEIKKKLYQVDDEMKAENGLGMDVLIVDHINLLKFSNNRNASVGDMVNEYVSFFRRLGKNFRKDPETGEYRKLIIVLLSQINRNGYTQAVKNNGRYTLTAIAEANELERSSQIIMMSYVTDEMKLSKEASVQLLKNRNGETISEPVSIFVDPECYMAGDEVDGIDSVMSLDDFDSVFDMDLGDIL